MKHKQKTKRAKTSEWVPIDRYGRCWILYKPGEIGNRDAYGYIGTQHGQATYYTQQYASTEFFSSMQSAACRLKIISAASRKQRNK